MSIVDKSKQDEGTENKEYGKIDDTDQKHENKITSNRTPKQQEGIDNKEYGKIDDTDQKPPEDKSTSVKKSDQEDGTDNKAPWKIDDTAQKPEAKVASFNTSKEEDETDNNEFDKIDNIDQNPEDKVTPVIKSEQEDETDNKQSDKVDDTDQKPDDKVTPVLSFMQEDETENKESDKVDDTNQKPDDKVTPVITFKQENQTENKESNKDTILNKVDGIDQKPEEKVASFNISKKEDGTDNNQFDKIDYTDQEPEDKIIPVITSDQEYETDNKESDKVDDTDQKPEEKVASFNTFKKVDGTDINQSDKIDYTDQKHGDKITPVIQSEQEDETDNKQSDKVDDIDQKPEKNVASFNTSKEEDETDINQSNKIDYTDQKPGDQITPVIQSEQEVETDNIESDKVDGFMKPDVKICMNNKFKIEDGPSFSIKTNHAESGESTAKLSLKNGNEELARNKKILLEDRTCVNNKVDSEDRLPLTTIDELYNSHTGEMSLSSSRTSEMTANSRKRNQKQYESLEDNEPLLLKKIKVEDTGDDQFHEMWDYLQYDFSNFNQWENILHFVDEQNIEVNARIAYSKFLELYPLCYGYWKKYANFEKRNNNIHEFEKVLENGLSAIPISVDLWIYYMTYLRTERYDEEDHIRNEFERSLKMCGLDFHSDQLWHDYISWEMEINRVFNAANIYYRLIRIPTSNYSKNFFKFQEFIFKQLPEEYLGLTEFFEKRNIIVQSFRTNHNSESFNHDCIPPGEDFQQVTEITETNIISIMRIEIIDEWYNVHKQTATEFECRKLFEENIGRPHFHVNELESAQVLNWENYIKFERRAGDQERIIFLYERCLIACVLIERFWLNYLDYLSFVNFDATILLSDVFKRSLFHHPKSLQLNLKYFDFCETQGWIEIAEDTITRLEVIYPESKEVVIRLLNLARRTQDDTLEILFKHYLSCSRLKSIISYIAIRYARFVWKHNRQLNLAFNILYDTIRIKAISVNDSLELYLTLVEVKMELNPKDHLSVLKTIDDIILQCNFYKEKLVFSKKKLEYIEDYINDYDMLRSATIEYKHLKKACFTEKKHSLSSTV